jgi:protein ImuB
MLFACIHTPDFPVQASLRTGSAPGISFQFDPIAVLDGPESLLKVFACNERARNAGIVLGMTKIQAEACPGVALRKRIIEQEEEAQAALVECARSFSPRVESTCSGSVIVDLTGAERLLGSQQEIGEQLAAHAAACGFTANIGMAANADTALHAARGFAGITLIAAGEEAQRLAGLPVAVLEPSPEIPEISEITEIIDTLESWGIRTFQALAALPAVPLTQRLGQAGLHLQQLARGEIQRELVPAEPAPAFQETAELEEAIDLLEPLGFILNRLLDELLDRLRARSLATDHVRVDLELEVHVDRQLQAENPPAATAVPMMPLHQRVLKLPVPTQDAKVLLKLLQLDLAAHPPQAPVKKITVEALPARLRLAQAGLFQPLAPEPARLEVTLARLRAAVGEKDEQSRQRVGFPQVTDSHRPDSFQVLLLGAEASQSSQKSKSAGRQEPERCLAAPHHPVTPTPGVPGTPPQLVMRWFRPPMVAWVECKAAQEAANRTSTTETRRHGEIRRTEQNRVAQAPGSPPGASPGGVEVPSPVREKPSLEEKNIEESSAATTATTNIGTIPATVIFNGAKAFVIQASGPWRSSGAWWDHAGQWQREEWDVDLNFNSSNSASGLYRIYRDLQTGQWFVEGMYD